MFGLIAPTSLLRNELILYLNKAGIGTRPFFIGIHQQPVFQEMGLYKKESYPVAEKLTQCGFYLPGGLGLSEEQILYITNLIKQYIIEMA
ncbi:hypothetical protein D9M68_524800 [compost metagenome]